MASFTSVGVNEEVNRSVPRSLEKFNCKPEPGVHVQVLKDWCCGSVE